jgi:hypothetical protein
MTSPHDIALLYGQPLFSQSQVNDDFIRQIVYSRDGPSNDKEEIKEALLRSVDEAIQNGTDKAKSSSASSQTQNSGGCACGATHSSTSLTGASTARPDSITTDQFLASLREKKRRELEILSAAAASSQPHVNEVLCNCPMYMLRSPPSRVAEKLPIFSLDAVSDHFLAADSKKRKVASAQNSSSFEGGEKYPGAFVYSPLDIAIKKTTGGDVIFTNPMYRPLEKKDNDSYKNHPELKKYEAQAIDIFQHNEYNVYSLLKRDIHNSGNEEGVIQFLGGKSLRNPFIFMSSEMWIGPVIHLLERGFARALAWLCDHIPDKLKRMPGMASILFRFFNNDDESVVQRTTSGTVLDGVKTTNNPYQMTIIRDRLQCYLKEETFLASLENKNFSQIQRLYCWIRPTINARTLDKLFDKPSVTKFFILKFLSNKVPTARICHYTICRYGRLRPCGKDFAITGVMLSWLFSVDRLSWNPEDLHSGLAEFLALNIRKDHSLINLNEEEVEKALSGKGLVKKALFSTAVIKSKGEDKTLSVEQVAKISESLNKMGFSSDSSERGYSKKKSEETDIKPVEEAKEETNINSVEESKKDINSTAPITKSSWEEDFVVEDELEEMKED